jgi:hypothetical protein
LHKCDGTAQNSEISNHRQDHFRKPILIVFEQMTKVGSHVRTTEIFEFKTLRAYMTLINARESFEQLAAPLIHMLERNICLEWMDSRLYEKFALLRVR